MYYYAIIEKEEEDFLVSFPDFTNINTFGDSLDNAMEMAGEALNGTLSCTVEKGFTLPSRTEVSNGYKIKLDTNIYLAYQLRELRGSKSQSEIASKLHMRYQTYQKLENPQKCNPTLKTLDKLAEIFDNRISINIRTSMM